MGNHWAFAAGCVLALSGCPTVDLGDPPPDIGLCNPMGGIDYFQSDIEPNYLKLSDPVNSCARSSSCHAMAHGLAIDTGDDPNALMSNYRLVQGYLDCGVPPASELLTKPLAGVDGHGGGDIFANLQDPAVVDFLAWFQ